jgi:DNA-binding NarL/FixJ family response regulator
MTGVNQVTCLIADDHPAVLDATARLLAELGISVVGTARDGEEALAKIRTRRPAVAVVDVRMPRLTGIEVARAIASERLPTAVVLYTGYGERALVLEAIDAGIPGFVMKEAPLGDLVRAVETVAGGGTYVDPTLAGLFTSREATDKLVQLTARERDILRLLAEGLHNDEIGQRLFISGDTVRAHVRKAMKKLNADTRTQAVATAFRQSLID